MNPPNKGRSAFTLVELLVVVAMVAIFGALVLPGLAQNRKVESTTVRCLANHAELIKAWQMYAADSDDYVANNYTIPGVEAAISKWKTTGVCDAWAPNVMTFSVGDSDSSTVTNTALARAGLLVPYHKNIFAYHCPADRFLSKTQKAAGWKFRLRSVSMNCNWGRTDPSDTKDGISTSWAYGSAFRQWHRLSEVRKPAQPYVFVDEQAGSINDGFFIVTWGNGTGDYPGTTSGGQWGDIPGFYHNNGTPFSFADGHTEIKRWLSRAVPVQFSITILNAPADIRDQRWYVQHVAERR
jgi:prepilin-type N-terminal cleavage/methylation domain-containing protein/prepilin-type processing-associated H-X9-DG protein